MLKKFLNPTLFNADLAVLVLRVAISLFMVRHGHDKFHNFIEGARDFPDPIGLGAVPSFLLTIFAEFFCSILLILGLFSRFSLITLIICMLVIIFKLPEKIIINDIEHAALFLIVYVSLLISGVGKYSLDNLFFNRK
jgi:putative oxidoreductase